MHFLQSFRKNFQTLSFFKWYMWLLNDLYTLTLLSRSKIENIFENESSFFLCLFSFFKNLYACLLRKNARCLQDFTYLSHFSLCVLLIQKKSKTDFGCHSETTWADFLNYLGYGFGKRFKILKFSRWRKRQKREKFTKLK